MTSLLDDVVRTRIGTTAIMDKNHSKSPEDIWKDKSVNFRQRLYQLQPNDAYTGELSCYYYCLF